MHGLRKQVTKAKDGTLEKESKDTYLRKEREEVRHERACMCQGERVELPGSFVLRIFIFSKGRNFRGGLRRASQ